MVDWFQIVTTIIGGGLFLFVFQTAFNELILVPRIDISVPDPIGNRTNVQLTNIGRSTATGVIVTIKGNNLSEPELFNSNTIDNRINVTIPVQSNKIQLGIPRISPGVGSNSVITLTARPSEILVTYEQGSDKWPPQILWSNQTFLFILVLSALGLGLIISSFVFRTLKRRVYRVRFIAKTGYDMNRVANELREHPYRTARFWTMSKSNDPTNKGGLYST
jgi:hypothetical protein